MIGLPERSDERDALLRATLPHVPALGWTRAAMAAGLRDLGEPPEAAQWLFPTGPRGALEAWCDLADREMAAGAALDGLRTPQRIRALIALRLRQAAPHREAVRRAVALQALPWNAGLAARTAARTADAMWRAAGDRSTDLSWYTRRATLMGLYGSVLAYWLADASPDGAATLDFLDRQMARLGRLQRRPGPRPPSCHGIFATPRKPLTTVCNRGALSLAPRSVARYIATEGPRCPRHVPVRRHRPR